jgi:hypothetical protein
MGVLQPRLSALGDDDLAALVRRDQLGNLNFQEHVDRLRVIQKIATALDDEPPLELPPNLLPEAEAHLTSATTVMTDMESFDLSTQGNAEHSALLDRIDAVRAWFTSIARPQIAGEGVVDMAEKSAQIAELHSDAVHAKAEADELLRRVKTAAGEVGASGLSGHYGDQAKGHGDSARVFLIASALFGAVLAIAAWFLLTNISVSAGKTQTDEWVLFTRRSRHAPLPAWCRKLRPRVCSSWVSLQHAPQGAQRAEAECPRHLLIVRRRYD